MVQNDDLSATASSSFLSSGTLKKKKKLFKFKKFRRSKKGCSVDIRNQSSPNTVRRERMQVEK